MAELITEDQPRIKFACALDQERPLAAPLSPPEALDAGALAALLAKAEAAGLTPLLNDGLAAGNCAMLAASAEEGSRLLVSRSGKRGGERASFVEVASFERAAWRAVFRRFGGEGIGRPSSDTPLLAALLLGVDGSPPLAPGARFLLHGHALADDADGGGGLALARALGAAVSERPTLFSTPEDLQEVEELLRRHPFGGGEGEGLYVRRGHGFFLLAESAAALEAALGRVLTALEEDKRRKTRADE